MSVKNLGQKRLSELREDEYFFCNELTVAERYKVGSDLSDGTYGGFDFRSEKDKYSDEYGWYQEYKVDRWFYRFKQQPPHSIMYFSSKDVCMEYQRKEMVKEFSSKTTSFNIKNIRKMLCQQYTKKLTCHHEIHTGL